MITSLIVGLSCSVDAHLGCDRRTD